MHLEYAEIYNMKDIRLQQVSLNDVGKVPKDSRRQFYSSSQQFLTVFLVTIYGLIVHGLVLRVISLGCGSWDSLPETVRVFLTHRTPSLLNTMQCNALQVIHYPGCQTREA